MNDLLRPGVDGYPESPGPSDVSTLGDGHLAKEIASGYDRYGSALATMGQWRRDPAYGVRWCPRATAGKPFVPYVTNGHWIPGEAAEPHPEVDPALARSPYWVSTDLPWGDITMHHGWWVRTGTGPTDTWCWIPGARETPASVLWREADGFVAWAPAAPDGEYDDSSDDDFLSWSFEFLGTLFEDVVLDVLLQGEAADAADAATSEERHRHNAVQRVGPTADRVAAARAALSEYASGSPSASAGGRVTRLPPVRVIFGQLAHDTRQGVPSGTRPSLPILSRSGGGGSTSGGRPSRVGSISGGGCASCRGASSGSSHGGGGGSSHSGHSGGSGGDCGSHSSHHR